MKKKFSFMTGMLVLFAAAMIGYRLMAAPPLELSGGSMYTESSITQGDFAGATGTNSVLCTANGAVTKGDVVIVAVTTPTYPIQVKTTTTAGDPLAFGVALESAAANATLRVARSGIVRVTSAVSCTLGQKFITSGTAGKVTGVATVAEGLYTGLSGTAIVGRALEIRTVSSGSGPILIELLGR